MATSKSRQSELKEPVLKAHVQEVNIVSFDHRRPRFLEIGNSIDLIKQHVFNADKLCFYPKLDIDEDSGIRWAIHQRLEGTYKSCFAYTAKTMAVSGNITAKPNSADAIYDAIVFVPDGPTTVFTVIRDKVKSKRKVLEYNQTLAKGVVASVRRYTKEQFSVVFGLVTESDLMDDYKFKDAINAIKVKTSKWCVPVTLSMSDKKFKEVTSAFLLSVAFTNCVFSEDDVNSLYCLTLEQFRVLTENIDHNQVVVNSTPSCGGDILLLEIAKRLEKSGPTTIVAKSEALIKTARRLSICKDHIIPADHLESKTMSDIVNVVADCDIFDKVQGIDNLGRIWYFIRGDDDTDGDDASSSVDQVEPAKHHTSFAAAAAADDDDDDDARSSVDRPCLRRDNIAAAGGVGSILNEDHTEIQIHEAPTYIRKHIFGEDEFCLNSSTNKIGSNDADTFLFQETFEEKNIIYNTPDPDDTNMGKRDIVFDGTSNGGISSEPDETVTFSTVSENTQTPDWQQSLLQERTRNDIKSWTTTAIRPSVLETANKRLEHDRVITITGQPGEGKTTLGFLLLKTFCETGWKTFALRTPEEYNTLVIQPKTMLMLNDIFGSFHFNPQDLRRWLSVLDDVQRHIYSSDVLVVLVTRDYILSEAKPHLAKFSCDLICSSKILNMSTEARLSKEDKLDIFRRFSACKPETTISELEMKKLVKTAFPFGFPYCCFLYFRFDNDKINVFEFFEKAAVHLDSITESFLLKDSFKKAALYLLLYMDGKVNISDLMLAERPSSKQYEVLDVLSSVTVLHTPGLAQFFEGLRSALNDLEGSYLKDDSGIKTFCHSAFHESIIRVVCARNVYFVIEHCSIGFIIFVMESFSVSSEYTIPLVRRFRKEIESGNISLVLSHGVFRTQEGVNELLKADIDKLLMKRDTISGKGFLHLASSNGAELLLKNINEIIDKPISTQLYENMLYGCCEFGNINGIQFLVEMHPNLKHSTTLRAALDISIEHCQKQAIKYIINTLRLSEINQEHFLKVAARGSDDVLELLLERGAKVNASDSNGASALYFACEKGNISAVKYLVLRGADLNARTNDKTSPLHIAVQGSHVECLDFLADEGADVNAVRNNGQTILHDAVVVGTSESVRILIGHKCDVNAVTDDGKTALHLAAKLGFNEIVLLLLRSKCQVNAADRDKCTPLHHAVLNGNMGVAETLVARGADVNLCNGRGWTSLCLAAERGLCNIVSLLITHGADVNGSMSITSLHLACRFGHSEVVKLLLQSGANVNRPTNTKNTPLMMAAPCVVEYLLEHQADVNTVSIDGRTVLHCSVFKESLSMVTAILDKGAMVNKADNKGITALHIAAYVGNTKIVRRLLLSKADISCQSNNGMTALAYAVRNGHTQTVTVLAKENVSLISVPNNEGRLPLHEAVSRNHTAMVRYLIQVGCDVNKKTKAFKTALMMACNNGNEAIVNSLLKAGSEAYVVDHRGWSACHFAAQGGHISVFKLLLEHDVPVHVKTNEGFTCLGISLVRDKPEMINYLLQAGCSPHSVDNEGRSMLHKAAAGGNRSSILRMIALGISINCVSKNGMTPLHYASLNENVGAVQELLDQGADINAVSQDGVSPIILASMKGNCEVVKELIRRGANVNQAMTTGITALHFALVAESFDIVRDLLQGGVDISSCDHLGVILQIVISNRNKVIRKELLKHFSRMSLSNKWLICLKLLLRGKGHAMKMWLLSLLITTLTDLILQ